MNYQIPLTILLSVGTYYTTKNKAATLGVGIGTYFITAPKTDDVIILTHRIPENLEIM